jgi:hypothetical protein
MGNKKVISGFDLQVRSQQALGLGTLQEGGSINYKQHARRRRAQSVILVQLE